MVKLFKTAIVGSGYIVRSHIDALNGTEGVQLAAIVARNREKGEKLAQANGAAYFETLREAKEQAGIDSVIICTPTYVHEQQVIEAANLGLHVLCEKPAAFSPEAFDRMVLACEANGVRLMIAQVVRFHPEYCVIKEFIDSGRLGKIHMAYEKRLSQHPDWADWHRNPQLSGGGLYDINVHDVDFAYHLFGRPESVYALGWQSETGCWNHVSSSFTFKNGAKAVVETSLEMTGSYPFSFELRITGDKGTIAFEQGKLIWYPVGSEMEILTPEREDMYTLQMREFFAAIREGRESRVPNREVRDVLEMINASERSIENNIVVKL